MSESRIRVYCCLRKLEKCKKRIEHSQQRTRLGSGDVRDHFNLYVGQNQSHLFNDDDVMCQSCFIKVRKFDPKYHEKKRKTPSDDHTSPKKLRSSKLYQSMECDAQPPGPSTSRQRSSVPPTILSNMVIDDVFDSATVLRVETRECESSSQVVDFDSIVPVQHSEWDHHSLDLDFDNRSAHSIVLSDQNSEAQSVPSQAYSHLSFANSQEFQSSIPPVESQSMSQSIIDSEMSSSSPHSKRTISRPIRRGEATIVLPGISTIAASESRCMVCHSRSGRCRVPNTALLDLWMKTRILVEENNRTCKEHLSNGIFLPEAIAMLTSTKPDAEVTGKQAAKWLIGLTNALAQRQRPIDFSLASGMTDADYKLLTGINKEPFNQLVDILKSSDMRDSSNRELRNALAIFLVMLRLNLSQRVLAFLFGIANPSVICTTIASVSKVLLEKFVPQHLGYHHLTREQLMQHQGKVYHTILNRDQEDMILILDGTYLYVEKSTDFYLQRRSYSSHKGRNLFKPMMVVSPDGYVVEADGLFFSDGQNNDAKILKSMWARNNSILSILMTRDCLVLDRGFKTAISEVKKSGVATFMPACIENSKKTKADKKTQFTVKEANDSRKITKLRWVVEAANGRLKRVFKFFYEVIPAGYFGKLNHFLKIALAIQNAYFPPLFTETEAHIRMAEQMRQQVTGKNKVQEIVKRWKLYKLSAFDWHNANADDLLEFPELTLEELELISLGPYQMKVGQYYNDEHLDGAGIYKYQVHKDRPGLIRVRLQSRFSKREKHLMWIQFKEFGKGKKAVLGYYCRCKCGVRTLGCCSHIEAVLRYLGRDRFLPARPRSTIADCFMDAAAALAEDSEDEAGDADEEEEEGGEEEEDDLEVV